MNAAVATERPPQKAVAPDKKRVFTELDEGAGRKVGERRVEGDLAAPAQRALRMHDFVDLRDRRIDRPNQTGIGLHPGSLELVVSLPATLGTRPMTGRERRCLVEEEQLAVAARAEHLTLSAPELQPAGHPSCGRLFR